MRWTAAVIVALGALLLGTVVADLWTGYGFYSLQVLKPVHYLGRDSYDLSAVRRYPSHRLHSRIHSDHHPDGGL
jgi:hypothetical protein